MNLYRKAAYVVFTPEAFHFRDIPLRRVKERPHRVHIRVRASAVFKTGGSVYAVRPVHEVGYDLRGVRGVRAVGCLYLLLRQIAEYRAFKGVGIYRLGKVAVKARGDICLLHSGNRVRGKADHGCGDVRIAAH